MPLIDTLNLWAASWTPFMGASLVDSSVLLAAASLIWLVTRRTMPPQFTYCLFGLVLLKLVVPIPVTAPPSLGQYSPSSVVMPMIARADSRAPVPAVGDVFIAQPPEATTAPATTAPAPRDLAGTTQPTAGRRPRIRVDQLVYDFGEVIAGRPVEHTFKLVNVGDAVLSIFQVRPACGCTTTAGWAKQVQPGGTWELPVTLRTHNMDGRVDKRIMVTTDDPDRPSVQFELKGLVRTCFKFEPTRSVRFELTDKNAVATQTLTITNQLEQAVVVKKMLSATPSFRAELREIEKGRRYQLDVTTVPPLKDRITSSNIKLETDFEEARELDVRVIAIVRPRVSVTPERLFFYRQSEGQNYRRPIALTNIGTTPVHVTEVRTSSPAVSTRIDTFEEGQRYRIWVTVGDGTSMPAAGETITILTDDQEFPKLTVTLRPRPEPRTRPSSSSPTPALE